MPDYPNDFTKATESRLGAFQFDWPEGHMPNSALVEKGPIELSNGAVYHGQWNKDGKREGIGIQVWKDGSKYTGSWKANRFFGKGRLIHNDGDCYEGEWLNDKA